MQFSRFSSCGLLIILVFWLNVNAAVPSVLRSAKQVLRTTSSMTNSETIDVKDPWINSSKQKSKTNDSTNWDIPQLEKRVTDKCANEAPRENQTYTRSIPSRSSSDPADDFKIAGEAQAKKTSSVHGGEEIVLCWIETTTIKEDPNSNPPRRLVIREFTITFENSASIPANYLDCNELEGEILPRDEETVRKSTLHEVIDENTKKSRELNFTHVSHVDGTVVRQHKKVKCGVGTVVTKDIFEWPDGTDNPKKRVEIKVGPSIRDLDAAPEEKPGECVSKDVSKIPQSSQRKSSSPDCTSGNCGEAATVSSCDDDGCSTENLPDRNAPTTYPPDSNEVLPTGVIRRMTTMRSIARKSSPLSTHRPEGVEDVLCLEGDVDCISTKATAMKSVNGTEKTPNCSGANCTGGSTDRPIINIPCDPSKNSSCLCSGENCASTERPTSGSEDFTETTANINELCKDDSESPSCSIHRFTDPAVPQSEDKKADKATMNSADGASNTTTESSTEPSTSRSASQKDSSCDEDSGECSVPLHSHFDEKPDGIGNKTTTSIGENSSPEPSREENGKTEVPNVVIITKLSGTIENVSRSLNVTSCSESGAEGCSIAMPDSRNSSVDLSSKSIEPNGSRRSSSCAADDESCKYAVTSDKSVPMTKPFDATTESTSKTLETETILSTTENPAMFPTRLSDEVTGTPITRTDPETSSPKPKAESKQGASSSNETSSSDNDPLTQCSADSESSGGCSPNIRNTTATPSPGLADTIKTSSTARKTMPLTLPSESCESSGSCGSIDETSGSDETNPATSANVGRETKITSSCDDSNRSCDSSASLSTASDNCEDGATDCRSEKASPTSVPHCDPASGSCSMETGDAMITTKPTPEGLENPSPINATVAGTADTRRSIGLTTSQSPPVEKRHGLGLRIKVLLEHIDGNKEREQLVQVERHLMLNERPNDHGNHSLTLQLQTLNNSMNFQTLKDILNCTVLENLSKDAIDWDALSKDVIDVKEVARRVEERESFRATTTGPSVEVSPADDDELYDSNDKSNKETAMRMQHAISKPLETTTKTVRLADPTTEKAILKSLPGVEDDLKNGVDRVLTRIARELDGPATTASNSTTETSSSKILKILSNPSDRRVHSKRTKRAPRGERMVSVRQLSSPVNGEEIERWSNERFVSAADGGQIRSLTEFRILRDRSGDSHTDSFGSVDKL